MPRLSGTVLLHQPSDRPLASTDGTWPLDNNGAYIAAGQTPPA